MWLTVLIIGQVPHFLCQQLIKEGGTEEHVPEI